MEAVSLSRRAEWLTAAFLSAALAVLLLILSSLKTMPACLVVAGLAGLFVLAVLPNRRIVLVLVFVFLHPLSIQKAFQLCDPQVPGFMPSFLVVSASDIALFLLILELR